MARNEKGSVEIVLKNNISGDKEALSGTSKLTPTVTFDTIYFGTYGASADFAIDNVTVTRNSGTSATLTSNKRAQELTPSHPGWPDENAFFIVF